MKIWSCNKIQLNTLEVSIFFGWLLDLKMLSWQLQFTLPFFLVFHPLEVISIYFPKFHFDVLLPPKKDLQQEANPHHSMNFTNYLLS